MSRRAKPQAYDQINVTPLMDLAWVLLIVFIIMATATVQGISVALPRASAAPTLARPHTRAVTVTQDGRVFLDTSAVTLPELERKLRQLYAADPDLPVVVRGEASVRYDEVVQVLDVVRRIGIHNIGLVTQRLVR
ncbi:MAG TPA: biopolymer transporter ExbD [Steroidobacteraceae bacterium]|nr:biopolymer transporter ExbD [Steroidobacteraceae bacterium]